MAFESDQNSRFQSEFSSVTQCPHCHTAFHIGRAHLDAAGSMVRCGGCLRVFNARKHFLVEQKHLFEDAASSQGHDTTVPEEVDPLDLDLFGALIPDDNEPVILGDFDHESGQSIPRSAILSDPVEKFKQEDYVSVDAEVVLRACPEDRFDARAGAGTGGRQHPELHAEHSPRDALDFHPPSESASTEADTHSTAGKDTGVSGKDSSEPYAGAANTGEDAEARVGDVSADSFEEPRHSAEQESFGAGDCLPEHPLYPAEFMDGAPSARSERAETLSPAHSFEHRHLTGTRIRSKLWWTALFLVSLALPVQSLYVQPQTLLALSWFREAGTVLCPYLGCPAPVFVEPEFIRISGVMEPHTEYQDGLIATIDLRNTAGSEQPFPSIAVVFRNHAGHITASRIFEPEDYLRGDARAYTQMPRNRNVQIQLELIDPGQQSTSYEWRVSP